MRINGKSMNTDGDRRECARIRGASARIEENLGKIMENQGRSAKIRENQRKSKKIRGPMINSGVAQGKTRIPAGAQKAYKTKPK